MAILGGAARRSRAARSAVPACEPWMPTLPSRPAAAAVSCMDSPTDAATGPTYFMVSPNDSRVVLELVKVLARASAATPISSAFILKPERMFEAMSAVRPRSVLPAAASCSMPGMAAMVCLVLNPAMAR